MTITASQCRGARGLLGLSQGDLSASSGVSIRTIQNFEAEARQAIPANVAAIRAALESAGVEFIAENGGGAGVRLKKERFGMNTSDETYRGHRLVVLLHRDGWKVSIGNTGMETGLHSEPSGALKEARVYVDKVLSARS
jgi:transcriptional regulator with XRE-family HTH domain